MTKDTWKILTEDEKVNKLSEALNQLKQIDSKDHPIKKKIDQGRLANVKKDLEGFIINAIGWESDNLLER